MRAWLSLAAVLLALGCARPWVRDPNVHTPDAAVDPAVMSRNIAETVRELDARAAKGEITPEARESMLQEYLSRVLKGVDPRTVPAATAWHYGDAFRLYGEWETAADLYAKSLAAAKDEDRRVNDSLRLARAKARLGDHAEALRLARSTFDAPPADKAPILLAVLYEIVPEGRESSSKADYAALLVEAVEQHRAVLVDPESESGRLFLQARPAHIRAAYLTAAEMFLDAGDRDTARRCIADAEAVGRAAANL